MLIAKRTCTWAWRFIPGLGNILAILDEREIELKKLAAQLTAAMLDNHNGDWDDAAVARAFKTIYQSVKDA